LKKEKNVVITNLENIFFTVWFSTKTFSSKTVFTQLHQISISVWFLEDLGTLKTGIMKLKIQLYNHRNISHF